MKEYVRSKGVYCPTCGRSRGVSLWVENYPDVPRSYPLGCYSPSENFIYCKKCRSGFRIIWAGIHSGYGSPQIEE